MPRTITYRSLWMCIAAMWLQQSAAAAQIIVTITGTVDYGADQTGVFGVPHTDIKGEGFTLVYTFDDTKAPETFSFCTGIPCGSMTSGSGLGSPGTAVLSIGSGSFRFGTLGAIYSNSSVQQSAPPNNSAIYYLVTENDEIHSSDSVQIQIFPPYNAPPLTTNYDWRDSFSHSQFGNGTYGQFAIELAVWPKNSCGPPVVVLEKTADSLPRLDRWSWDLRQFVCPRK